MKIGDGARVAVVLSGAAARGAFQAGALGTVLVELERVGASPTIVLGTSAGGINAALYGGLAHQPAERAAADLQALWRQIDHRNVFVPIPLGAISPALQFASGAVFGCGPGTTSLLNTCPLTLTACRRLDPIRLQENVHDESVALSTIGVVATRVPPAGPTAPVGISSGRTVIFLDEAEPSDFAGDAARGQIVERGAIRRQHVLASAAIPIAFPPQHVDEPASAAGWYVDGGVRLNAPLRPAIRLDATHVVVISATSIGTGPEPPADPHGPPPDAADTGAQLLNAVLVDQLTQDLLRLEGRNRTIGDPPREIPRIDDPDDTYRVVPFITIAPRPGEMGWLADAVHRERTTGCRTRWQLDNRLLGRALRGIGDGAGRRELLSYLLFDREYFAQSIGVGQSAAQTALADGWRTAQGAATRPLSSVTD